MNPVRLQKYLADAGVASRRQSEELIIQGRVRVDGKVVTLLGSKVDPINSKVEVDNETILPKKTNTYLAFNKPAGVLSTMSDPEGRPHLGDYFANRSERLFHVGRLDKESEGLIFITNDGYWAQKVTHPAYSLPKKYWVEIAEEFDRSLVTTLRKGVQLEDGWVRPQAVEQHRGGIEITITEGRNQIIRRTFAHFELTVLRLVRISLGPIYLGELPVGKWRNLQSVELTSLFND
jgi:23S rRNA pseudouridine2605 synthase